MSSLIIPSHLLTKLDLGAGQHPQGGFEGVDLHAPNAAHKVDLLKFPWPWVTSSVDEIFCSHFIEHIPAREVEVRDMHNYEEGRFVGKDMFFAFFDECWRILKPNATMTLVWPALRSVRAFQDPTHRRFIPVETMLYLNADWRKANSLDHYRVNCHFVGETACRFSNDEQRFSPEEQAARFNHFWNTLLDFEAKLKAIKS